MKRILLPLFLLLAVASAQTRTLNLLTWSEYIDPEIIALFEERFDARVELSYYESNEEALAKLQAGGLGLYDLLIPSDYMVPVMIELGVLQGLDHSLIPNMVNLQDTFIDPPYDPGNIYTIAYQWGTTGIVYRTDLVDETPTSWSVIFEGDKPTALLDASREMIAAALIYLGFDANSEDRDELIAARDALIQAKATSIGFYSAPAARTQLLTGGAVYAVTYSGIAFAALTDSPNIGYILPDEGAQVWVDSMAVITNAPQPELAHAFINFLLEPEIGAMLSNYVGYATPNREAFPLVAEELRNNPIIYPDAEAIANLSFILPIENLELYDLIWTQVKAR